MLICSGAKLLQLCKNIGPYLKNDGPLLVVLESSLPSSTKNKLSELQSWAPFDKTFRIRACHSSLNQKLIPILLNAPNPLPLIFWVR